MKQTVLMQKSIAFAIRIINLYKHLTDKKKEFVLSKQILRSGTSIGANLSEAYCASSKKDFLNKVYIAFKESEETLYWLTLLKETKYITNKEFDSIYADNKEIAKMLSSTTNTIKKGLAATC